MHTLPFTAGDGLKACYSNRPTHRDLHVTSAPLQPGLMLVHGNRPEALRDLRHSGLGEG